MLYPEKFEVIVVGAAMQAREAALARRAAWAAARCS